MEKTKNYPVIDGHNDALIVAKRIGDRFTGSSNVKNQVTLPLMKKGGVAAAFWAVFVSPKASPKKAHQETIAQLRQYRRLIESNPDRLVFGTGVGHINQAIAEKKTAIFLHIEGFNAADSDLRVVDEIYELGVRSIGFTWNAKNQLGAGSTSDPNEPLSALGRRLVRKMNKMGMLVDTSHLNEAGFWDVLSISSKPVIETHGNCFVLCPNPRNIKDDQLRALAAKKGVVGVFFSKKFLTGGKSSALGDVCNHLDHVAQVAGIEAVGIGSDFGGIISGVPDGLENIGRMQALFRAMAGRGYGRTNLEKISFGNFYRVVKEVLG